ncbi:MAG: hypothetical protein KC503_20640 [Myxococcales bacterium]|nr:hypothetical protein [Myxococcales bacterium]
MRQRDFTRSAPLAALLLSAAVGCSAAMAGSGSGSGSSSGSGSGSGTAKGSASGTAKNSARAIAAVSGDVYPVPKPPFSKGIFPCTECHDTSDTPNTKRRVLSDQHEKIKLHHGPRERWCFDCHNPNNRDKLRLASGRLISFTESYKLCGQCHGPKLRDWRVGVHGKRTGSWRGRKRYLLCAHCHNPHSPRFKPIKPMPPPVRTKDIR